MEVKQTGHRLLIILSDHKSFRAKKNKIRQREFFSNVHVIFQLQYELSSPQKREILKMNEV